MASLQDGMSGCGTDWSVFPKTLIINSSAILKTGSELFQTSSELISTSSELISTGSELIFTGSELIRTNAEQILTMAHRVVHTTAGRWKNRLIIFVYLGERARRKKKSGHRVAQMGVPRGNLF